MGKFTDVDLQRAMQRINREQSEEYHQKQMQSQMQRVILKMRADYAANFSGSFFQGMSLKDADARTCKEIIELSYQLADYHMRRGSLDYITETEQPMPEKEQKSDDEES